MSKVIDSIRFGYVGIVKVKPDHGPIKYYIGLGAGMDQLQDEKIIQEIGIPFRLPEGFISKDTDEPGKK